MSYPSPTTVNMTKGLSEFFPYLNEVTNFWFGRMIMVAIFIMFGFGYLAKNKDDYIGAFAVSSYVTFVIGLIFWTIGLVSGMDFAVIIGVTVISSVILFTQKDR